MRQTGRILSHGQKGKQLAALNSCSYCYNLIYNSVPEYLLDKPDEIRNMGVDALRLSFP